MTVVQCAPPYSIALCHEYTSLQNIATEHLIVPIRVASKL